MDKFVKLSIGLLLAIVMVEAVLNILTFFGYGHWSQ